jgi:hypothetical protein
MQRTLVVIYLILLVSGAVVLWLLVEQGKANRKVASELAAATAARQAILASNPRSKDLHEDCRLQVTRLEAALSNALALVQISEGRLRELETFSTATSPPAVELPPPATPPPPAPAKPPAASAVPVFYETLRGAGDRVLGTNLEFSAVYGRRVAFKEVTSSRRVAFDIEQLHPSVLAALGIDPVAQKEVHTRQELAWKRLETYGLALAAAEERRRQELRAAREAERAEAERQMAQQPQPEQPVWPNGDPSLTPAPGQLDPALTPLLQYLAPR